jgi:hypothetical protein
VLNGAATVAKPAAGVIVSCAEAGMISAAFRAVAWLAALASVARLAPGCEAQAARSQRMTIRVSCLRILIGTISSAIGLKPPFMAAGQKG